MGKFQEQLGPPRANVWSHRPSGPLPSCFGHSESVVLISYDKHTAWGTPSEDQVAWLPHVLLLPPEALLLPHSHCGEHVSNPSTREADVYSKYNTKASHPPALTSASCPSPHSSSWLSHVS